MALQLKLKPRSHPSLRLFSSSSSPFPPPPSDQSPPESESESQPSSSSYFNDIRQRLGSSQSPPSRIPTNPSPPPSLFPPKSDKPSASLDEIRKQLANFRLGNSSTPSPPSTSPPRFQELFKNNLPNNPPGSPSGASSFESIRQSLNQSRGRDAFFSIKTLQERLRNKTPEPGAPIAPSLIGSDEPLPESIFGKEVSERKREEGEGESKGLKTQFFKSYTYQELGEKLVKLRPAEGEKKKEKQGFSLTELNQRLVELRKLEEEEAKNRGGPFAALRESLNNIQNIEETKKRQQRMPILSNLGGLAKPSFMLKPPQEHLLEKYFHPDHMSSAEKMKLELQKVRDEFKLSESDCGSARVQVAQLTTKIKHLSTVLHKKDKHSRKGLQEMVQRRKKLLKYLRRTDWDSYCLVLSRLGLRDVPEYKAPDYKIFKTQTKNKSKSKSKSKSKGKMKA
ncbi:30S ribosomal protein S15 [Rhynchospora pubera]|uniref:Small ribosomal subunit protein uS15c n=1 Tax=Rhynchospora pubera TaxID=906938 RepID=A0AAV8E9C3_9POAL|nr:30S ribosomal protein S15 [Rhynchospora pubera]